MRVAIVGSRNYSDPERVRAYVRKLPPNTVVVSGGARGVDTWAVEEAKLHLFETVVFPADWNKWGKSAGYVRNITIVENADRVVAFWDGGSRGTMHTIRLAHKYKKPVEVYIP